MSGYLNTGKTAFAMLLLLGFASAGSYLIIIDASYSMDDSLPSGQTRIEAAKEAAIAFVNASSGNEIAVMKFHTCEDGGNPETGDIRVIEDFTSDKAGLRSAINSIETGPYTPIGEAIAEGRKYIKDELNSKGTIILITDGGENCGGDPVLEAQRAYDEGIAVVNVVSYAIEDDEEALELHKDIAEAGGGKYYTADNQEELQEVLRQIGAQNAGFCCLPAGLFFALLGMGLYANARRKR